jgi:hypothetical protein
MACRCSSDLCYYSKLAAAYIYARHQLTTGRTWVLWICAFVQLCQLCICVTARRSPACKWPIHKFRGSQSCYCSAACRRSPACHCAHTYGGLFSLHMHCSTPSPSLLGRLKFLCTRLPIWRVYCTHATTSFLEKNCLQPGCKFSAMQSASRWMPCVHS